MVHFVIDVVDRGTPIMTVEIPCRNGEDIHQLEARIHAEEHALIVTATQQVAQEVLQLKKAKPASVDIVSA